MTPLDEAELKQLVWIENQMRRCAAKTKYYSAAAAQIYRGPHSKHTPKRLWTYHCRWCGFYHLTSKRPLDVADDQERRAA